MERPIITDHQLATVISSFSRTVLLASFYLALGIVLAAGLIAVAVSI